MSSNTRSKTSKTKVNKTKKETKKDIKPVKKVAKIIKPVKKVAKTIIFKGKKIKYNTVYDLRKKLGAGVTVAEAKKFRDEYLKKNTEKIVVQDGDIERVDISKQLLLQSFGVQRTTTKQVFGVGNVKGLSFNDSIGGVKVKLTLRIKFQFEISDDTPIREHEFREEVDPKNINDEYLIDLVENQYLHLIDDAINVKILEYKITSQKTNQKFKLTDGKLRDVKPLNIDNIYGEVIMDSKWTNCVTGYMKSIYTMKVISPKTIDALGDENGVTTIEIYHFCVKYNIKMIAYDILGNVIKANYPTKMSHKHSLIFIAYNNHMYPLKNVYLNKVKVVPENISLIDNGNYSLIKLLEDGILPSNIKVSGGNIISFVVKKIKFISNPHYETCLEILKKFGLDDKIYDSIHINDIGNIIEKMYINGGQSFFPHSSKFRIGGYTYTTEDCDYELNNVKTIDKNKCYPYCLSKLDKLLYTDIRTSQFIKGKQKLKDDWLYIVRPKGSSVLLPDTNLYTGKHLIYCKREGLKFEILEGLECSSMENKYTQMILDMEKKLPKEQFKKIMVIMIGKFESDKLTSTNNKFIKICNNEEAKTITAYKTKLGQEHMMLFEENTTTNLYNRKPIAVQIKDYSRKMVYEKMKEMKLKDSDIIQIKTDSITFIDNGEFNELDLGIEFNNWKEEEFKPLSNEKEYHDNELSFMDTTYSDIDNIIGDCYAGCGKTYEIINFIIPKLGTDNFIVLTPSNQSLIEYKEANIKSQCIQRYELSNTIPEEDVIIVDEIGMCSKYALGIIYKCKLIEKKIICYGDFKQMLPPRELKQLNGTLFMNHMFSKVHNMTANRRNDFTKKYYDQLINEDINVKKEVKKHSVKNYEDADIIICYRNTTTDIYNKKMCDKLGIENRTDKDALLICKTNDLRDRNTYNNFVLSVIDGKEDKVQLSNKEWYTTQEINDNFKFGYARTIYGVQGASIRTIYYAPEDYFFLNGRSAYTVISRIKTK
jgi:hypothetical protein